MPDADTSFVLKSRNPLGDSPVLSGVEASGRLEGMLFELTLRQTYRNAGDSLLEVVYTFPLPHEAVLLGFASELNGQRQTGTIVAKRQAEAQYEKSLAEGDAPVMLEASWGGLHTANIGNLKPGDEIVLEVRYAQLLRFEQGRLRLAIPTTIAPRYGNAADSELQPHQEPTTSLTAEYPLALSVTVAGNWANGTIECPTHQCTREAVEEGVRLRLREGAWMDRDVVIVATPLKPLTTVVTAATDDVSPSAPVVVMASFQPPHAAPRAGIALKLLVDCSGSMAGDSIASARVALQGALDGLTDEDQVSVSRFGTTVEHVFGPVAVTPRAQRHVKAEIARFDADLGGTEMAQALLSVFEIKMSSEDSVADVLMFTDGQIWNVEPMIAAARKSGHRVFVIGVGSSAAEHVLRSLAEATGGACEFATPGEALEAASARMLLRMRQPRWRDARIEWRGDTVWQTPVPLSVLGGDTVVVFAGMRKQFIPPVAVLWAKDANGKEVELASGVAEASGKSDTLPRMAAARRLTMAYSEQAQALAVSYQLMSSYTNCILVHERAEADKAMGEAELHHVSSMLAAGWGASSGVWPDPLVTYCVFSNRTRSMPMDPFDEPRRDGVDHLASFVGTGSMPTGPVVAPVFGDPYTLPPLSELFLGDDVVTPVVVSANRTTPESHGQDSPMPVHTPLAHAGPASLAQIARAVVTYLVQYRQLQGLSERCQSLTLHADTRKALDKVIALGMTEEQALLLMAHWTNERTGGLASSFYTSVLQPHVDGLEPTWIGQSTRVFERLLGGYTNSGWELSRAKRLRRLLSPI